MKGIIKLQEAIAKCKDIINSMSVADPTTELRAKLEKMTKKQLVEYIIENTKTAKSGVTVQDIAYTILEDEECLLLSYKDIAEIMNENIPGNKTTAGCFGWYKSNADKKGRNPLQRYTESKRLKIISEM